MVDPADTRFLKALKELCAQTGDIDPAFRDLIDRADATGDPVDLRAMRKGFDRLDTALRETVMRQVHLRMATDMSAIWDALPGAPDKRRPN